MANVYTLANAKGGCGKSTVALNLAVCFSRAGYRTLAVDLAQQGTLSAALGADLNKLKLTAHRLLIDDQAEISSFLLEPRSRLKLLDTSREHVNSAVRARRGHRSRRDDLRDRRPKL